MLDHERSAQGKVRSATVRDFCPALIARDRAWYHTWKSVLLATNLKDGSFFVQGSTWTAMAHFLSSNQTITIPQNAAKNPLKRMENVYMYAYLTFRTIANALCTTMRMRTCSPWTRILGPCSSRKRLRWTVKFRSGEIDSGWWGWTATPCITHVVIVSGSRKFTFICCRLGRNERKGGLFYCEMNFCRNLCNCSEWAFWLHVKDQVESRFVMKRMTMECEDKQRRTKCWNAGILQDTWLSWQRTRKTTTQSTQHTHMHSEKWAFCPSGKFATNPMHAWKCYDNFPHTGFHAHNLNENSQLLLVHFSYQPIISYAAAEQSDLKVLQSPWWRALQKRFSSNRAKLLSPWNPILHHHRLREVAPVVELCSCDIVRQTIGRNIWCTQLAFYYVLVKELIATFPVRLPAYCTEVRNSTEVSTFEKSPFCLSEASHVPKGQTTAFWKMRWAHRYVNGVKNALTRRSKY